MAKVILHIAASLDGYIASVIPILLGAGISLFLSIPNQSRHIRLIEAKSYTNGIVQLHYERC